MIASGDPVRPPLVVLAWQSASLHLFIANAWLQASQGFALTSSMWALGASMWAAAMQMQVRTVELTMRTRAAQVVLERRHADTMAAIRALADEVES